MEESAVVLIIKENSPLFHPPVVHMVKGVFDVDLNSIPSWHLACKYTTGSDLVKWWRRWDLNPQPPQCECGALPLSYVPMGRPKERPSHRRTMVETMGIEPTTPSMPWKCSTVELRPPVGGAGKDCTSPLKVSVERDSPRYPNYTAR